MSGRIIVFCIVSMLVISPITARDITDLTEESSLTRVEFTAYSDEARRPTACGYGFRLTGGVGVGFPKMGKVNDYVAWINDNFSGSIDDIDRYYEYRLQVDYPVYHNWRMGVAYNRIDAATDGTLTYMATTHDFEIDLEVEGAELYLENTWPRLIKHLSIRTHGGFGYYWSEYIETEDGYRASGDDEDWGFRLGLGLTWHAMNCLDIMLDSEYRWLEFADYEADGRKIRFVSPGNGPVEVDFSGLALRLGLAWRF